MMVGEIILAVSAKDARERERESMCVGGGGFLRANNRESEWDTLENEKRWEMKCQNGAEAKTTKGYIGLDADN